MVPVSLCATEEKFMISPDLPMCTLRCCVPDVREVTPATRVDKYEARPIRGQSPGHVITLSPSDASPQVT